VKGVNKLKTTSRSWSEYYNSKQSLFELLSDSLLHLHYLGHVIRIKPVRVLEAGCGPGNHSIVLAHFLRDTSFVLIDNDEAVVEIARKNVEKHGLEKRLTTCRADIMNLPFGNNSFDVAISQGVLEHFADRDFSRAIGEQVRASYNVIFSVPSDNYFQHDFGDELLRPPVALLALLKDYIRDNMSTCKVKYYRYDLGVRTRIALFKKLRLERNALLQSLVAAATTPMHILGVVAKASKASR